ncbi:FadR/GntR family transcriptional regulator [Lichenibacterium minor]|nr:FadR/GntR family transcriptional regulator [Lichenibacterium minor]
MNWTPLSEPAPGDRVPVSRGIAERLQALILQGGLAAGDRLPSQRDLAARLGVSRPSLREAMAALETMGLVVVRVGSGVYVAPPALRAPPWRFADRCSLRDVYEARLGLEGYAARLAAGRMDGAGALRLDEEVNAMASSLERGDVAAMALADARFHDLVVEFASNPVLIGMVGPMRDMMVESQRLPMARADRLSETLVEHRAVASRLREGDAAGAERAMASHIRGAADRYGVSLA